jgi:hypothetical protein
MKQLTINPDSSFFPIFSKAIKAINYPKKEMTIQVLDKQRSSILHKQVFDKYKFMCDWQSEEICGVDVFQLE